MLKNAANGTIAYTLMNGANEFASSNPLTFTANGSKTLKEHHAGRVEQRCGGTFTDTITFTVSTIAQ